MIKTMQIDFLREIFVKEFKSNNGNNEYLDDIDISLFTFYEHLTSDDEVNRYVERYRDLIDQQNKANTVAFGVLSMANAPTITNLRTMFISPFEWNCTIRTTMGNRDKLIATIYKMVENLKGRKCDVAQFNNGKVLKVGTITDTIKDYDYIGEYTSSGTLTTDINNLIASYFTNYGIQAQTDLKYVYAETNGKIYLFKLENNEWYLNEVEEHDSFEKYKMSLSFDDIVVNQPYNLNASEYCEITFSGSATLCSKSNRLGNDLVKVFIAKDRVKYDDNSNNDYLFRVNNNIVYHEVEPLDMPNNLNINKVDYQLRSSMFLQESHNDSISASLTYQMALDLSNELIAQWFKYARYGELNMNGSNLQYTSMTPNIIYKIKELWSSWGDIELHILNAKVVEDIKIENTESDTMTISLNFQVIR